MSPRPQTLAEFHGQPAVVAHLAVSIKAALSMGRPHGHVLLVGAPGLGKSSLGAHVLPTEMMTNARIINCSAVEKPQDLYPSLAMIQKGEILFLDEIHALPRPLIETLYTVMEDLYFTIVVGEGDSRQPLRVEVQPFTLVGATTREGFLTGPLRDRFRHVLRLDLYRDPDMEKVLQWIADRENATLASKAKTILTPACHGTARHAVSLIEACIEQAVSEGAQAPYPITKKVATSTLKRLRISPDGLTHPEQQLLRCLAESGRGTLGLATISAMIDEESTTIEEVYEPWLLRSGFIEKTPGGRAITDKGRQALTALKGTDD